MAKKSYKKYINATIATAVVAASVMGTSSVVYASKNFPDVEEKEFFYDAVKILTERGIISGYPDGTFKPFENVTRGQTAVLLAKLLKLDTTNVEDPGFIDLPRTHPYYGSIAALYNSGYISGYPDKTYRLDEPISRYHMSVILSKAFNFKAKNTDALPFTDVNPTYKDYVAALFELGITEGISQTTFGGSTNLTRGQFVTFLLKSEDASKPTSNNQPPTTTPPPSGDNIAPTLSILTNLVLIGQDISLSSNETGSVYLTNNSTRPTSVNKLEEIDLQKKSITTANNNEVLKTNELQAGTYYIYAVDNAGNISNATTIQLFDDPEAYISAKIDELSIYAFGKKESELDENDQLLLSDDEKALEILKRFYVILMASFNYSDLSGIAPIVPTVLNNIESSGIDESSNEGEQMPMIARLLYKLENVIWRIEFTNFINFNLLGMAPLKDLSPMSIVSSLSETPSMLSAEVLAEEDENFTPQQYAKKLDSTLKIFNGLLLFINEDNTELKQFDSELVQTINYVLPYLYFILIDTQFNPNTYDEGWSFDDLLSDVSLEQIEWYYEFEFDKETKRMILESLRTYLYNEYYATLMINRVFKNPSANLNDLELIDSVVDIVDLEALFLELGISEFEDYEDIGIEMNEFIYGFINNHLMLTHYLNGSHYSSVDQKYSKAIELWNVKYPEDKISFIGIEKIEGATNQFKIVPHYFEPTLINGSTGNLIVAYYEEWDSLKVDTNSSLSYSLWEVSSNFELDDNIYVTESLDGIISIQVEDSNNNGSLNGFYVLEIYDEESDLYREISFIVRDNRVEVINMFENSNQMNSYIEVTTNAIDEYWNYTWEETYNPSISWDIDQDSGLLGYSYLVIMYDSTTDKVHWVVKDIPRLTNSIDENAASQAGEVVVEYLPPEIVNSEFAYNDMLVEVYLLKSSSIDLTGVDTSSYKSLISKIKGLAVAWGYVTGTIETVPIEIILLDSPEESTTDPIDDVESGEQGGEDGSDELTEHEGTEEGEPPAEEDGASDIVVEEGNNEPEPEIETETNDNDPVSDSVSYNAKDTLDFGAHFTLVNGIVKIV